MDEPRIPTDGDRVDASRKIGWLREYVRERCEAGDRSAVGMVVNMSGSLHEDANKWYEDMVLKGKEGRGV